jgi:hypothetical protein
MAVWAQHSEILEAMVVAYPVYVIDVNAQGPTAPFRQATRAAAILEKARSDQAPLEMSVAAPTREKFCDRHPLVPRLDFSSHSGLIPSLRIEPKFCAALSIRMAFIVVGLNLRPIVFATPIRKQRRRGF